MPFIPETTEDKLLEIQTAGLQWTVRHAFEQSPFYRQRMEQAGVHPDNIRSLDDLRLLPFCDAADLQTGYPFPLRSVPFEDIVRIHASSGTTGKRKVLAYTRRDIDDWQDMFARCFELAELTPADRVQIAVGYGLWTAGAGFQLGCERFGAMAVPLGPANSDMHCEMLVDLETTVFCATASMALLMAEELHQRGLIDKVKVRKIILGAERHSDAMRQRIRELLGVEHIFDIYGLTELYGPGTGLDCVLHRGIHYWADYFILEILDPITMQPVPPGEPGEMVITTLRKQAAPLIRYRTHDITRLLPGACPCGVRFPLHDRVLGRTDDMFIYRAVNIYPGQIDDVLSRIPGLGSEYQIHLHHRDDGRDIMTLKVERAPHVDSSGDRALADAVAGEVRRRIMVRSNVDILDYAALPRTERKSKRVYDHRGGVSSFLDHANATQ
ncbi:phenylacetate-CoA ligase [Desulfonatronum thiosulfatophilum]|uniref:Phenylacetate-coenzyme A ligase n=1 Tax=Desulfonatronum thiosulfatophilum TaxID=617002 RepID=A0A1G6E1P5_9BACT|nr:phenylacetate--CoA ligase [Desulfonatronum thiosulfatophilum]SDB51292.1 phenylacetate-CoA ligase [Desulfonatronum thiosulfatophilum]